MLSGPPCRSLPLTWSLLCPWRSRRRPLLPRPPRLPNRGLTVTSSHPGPCHLGVALRPPGAWPAGRSRPPWRGAGGGAEAGGNALSRPHTKPAGSTPTRPACPSPETLVCTCAVSSGSKAPRCWVISLSLPQSDLSPAQARELSCGPGPLTPSAACSFWAWPVAGPAGATAPPLEPGLSAWPLVPCQRPHLRWLPGLWPPARAPRRGRGHTAFLSPSLSTAVPGPQGLSGRLLGSAGG